jgi:hypothetical protein
MKREAYGMPEEGPVGKIKSRSWLPGNLIATTRKGTSWGKPTGEVVTTYSLEDGTKFAEEVANTKGEIISRRMWVREGDQTRQLSWEVEKDEVSEYVTTKDANGIVSSGWNKIG